MRKPTCISYLAEEASDRLEFLPSWDSMDQDLLLLYGQYRSTLVDHMDVEKSSHFDELETSLFHFYLPSSYLCFVCSPEEFDLFNLGIPPNNCCILPGGKATSSTGPMIWVYLNWNARRRSVTALSRYPTCIETFSCRRTHFAGTSTANEPHLHRHVYFTESLSETVPRSLRLSCGSELEVCSASAFPVSSKLNFLNRNEQMPG
ncbi:unnamed protein product [Lactuca saligna]|uniref:Uncharacterized protein n=1 Tax=Lactuca saligna TaxID=75948 RepID=A0AA35Y6Y8_LACSI|nr:unnamed protein product [Lactuca saligna]